MNPKPLATADELHSEPNADLPDGAALLDELSRFISHYVVLTSAQAHACALWIMHTYAMNAAEFTPYLHIYSPLLQSGKTLLLTVLSLFVAKPWYTGRVTAAVLMRKTEKEQPTFCSTNPTLHSRGRTNTQKRFGDY